MTARFFELKLLTIAGFQPQVFDCADKGEPLQEIAPDELYGWSPPAGGVLCPTHAQGRSDASRLSLNAMKVLRHALARNMPRLPGSRRAKPSPAKWSKPC